MKELLKYWWSWFIMLFGIRVIMFGGFIEYFTHQRSTFERFILGMLVWLVGFYYHHVLDVRKSRYGRC